MRLTQDFRSQLYGPWETAQGFLVEQFDHLIAQIIASYGKQHTAEDAHGDITCTSLVVTGQTTLGQGYTLNDTGDLFPPLLTANTNDYNPVGLSTASIIHHGATAPVNLTGLQAPTDQTKSRIIIFMPTGGSFTTFVDSSPLSLLNNRFRFPTGNYVFGNYPLALIWDTTSFYRQWRPLFFGGI